MNITKKLFLGLIGAGLASSMALPVSASSSADGNFGSSINIQAEATNLSMTVPANIAMVFNADGTDTVPSNFTISNDSKIGGVHLTSVKLDAKESGWQLVPEGTDLKTQAVNTKNIKLKVGDTGSEKIVAPTGETTAPTGEATFTEGEFDIESSGSKTLSFKVERGTFSSPVESAKAFDMTLNFQFNAN